MLNSRKMPDFTRAAKRTGLSLTLNQSVFLKNIPSLQGFTPADSECEILNSQSPVVAAGLFVFCGVDEVGQGTVKKVQKLPAPKKAFSPFFLCAESHPYLSSYSSISHMFLKLISVLSERISFPSYSSAMRSAPQMVT